MTIYVGQQHTFVAPDRATKIRVNGNSAKAISNFKIIGVTPGIIYVQILNSVDSILDTVLVHVVEPTEIDLFEKYPNFPKSISIEVGESDSSILNALTNNVQLVLGVHNTDIATISNEGIVIGVEKGNTSVTVVIYNSTEPLIQYAAEIPIVVTEPDPAGQDTDEDEDDTPAEDTTDPTEQAGNNIVYLGSYSGTTTIQSTITLQAFDGLFASNYVPRQFSPTELSFSSNDTSVATVDANGVITGVSAGTTYINVTKGSFADSNPITRYLITVLDLSKLPMNMPNYVNVYLDNPGYQYPLTANELGNYRVSSVSAYNNLGTTGALRDLSIAGNVGGQLLSFTATAVGEVMIKFDLSLNDTNITTTHHMIVNVYDAPPVREQPETPPPTDGGGILPDDIYPEEEIYPGDDTP